MDDCPGIDVGSDTGCEIRRAALMVDRILKRAVLLMMEQGETRSGGYFCLSGKKMSPLVLIRCCGEVPEEKCGKYAERAREKLTRLADHTSHFTSYQSSPDMIIVDSQNNERPWGKWGGAVRARNYIASFSGLPELWDEAMMLVLAVRMSWLSEKNTLRRIGPKRNPYLRPLLETTKEIEE